MAQDPATHNATALLARVHQGDDRAMPELVEALYQDLRVLAQRQLRQKPRRDLQTTALVHELYMNLVERRHVHWRDRSHFFAACATAMRHILIDAARRAGRQKRGADQQDLPLLESIVGTQHPDQAEWILSLDQCLRGLAARDRDLAKVFELRYFGGYSAAEVAEIEQLSKRTVERRWTRACAWLRTMIDTEGPAGRDALREDARPTKAGGAP